MEISFVNNQLDLGRFFCFIFINQTSITVGTESLFKADQSIILAVGSFTNIANVIHVGESDDNAIVVKVSEFLQKIPNF